MDLLCKLKSEYQSSKGIEDFLKDYENKDIFLEFNMSLKPYFESHILSLFKIEDELLGNFFRIYLKNNISKERRIFFISLLNKLIPLAHQYKEIHNIKDSFMCAIFKEKEVLAYLEFEFSVFNYINPGDINISLHNIIFNVSLLKDFIKEIKHNNLFVCFEGDINLPIGGRSTFGYYTKKINALDYLSDFLKELEKDGIKFLQLEIEAENLFLLRGIKLHEKGFRIIFNRHEYFPGNCTQIPDFIHTTIKKDYEDKAERIQSVIIQQKEGIAAYLPFEEFLEYSAGRILKELKIRSGSSRIRIAKNNLLYFLKQKLSLFSNIFFNVKIISKKSDFFKNAFKKISESRKETLKLFKTNDDSLEYSTAYINSNLDISHGDILSKLIIEKFRNLFSREAKDEEITELTFKTKEGRERIIRLIRDYDYKKIVILNDELKAAIIIELRPDGKARWKVLKDIIFDEYKYKDFILEIASIAGISEKEIYFLMKKIKKKFLL